MPRQNRTLEGLVRGSCKIRKRGCSSSSSTSSVLQNYRLKRAILVGKPRGSRSSTPVPAWKTSSAMRTVDSPKYAASQCTAGGKSRPVSARKLAATLWEMNEVPSPRMRESSDEKKLMKREMRVRERMHASSRSIHSGSFPPHLSDPSHSPVSERMDRSVTGSRHRRTSSISQRIKHADHNVGVLDSLSNASLMETETRSRTQTPSVSVAGVRTRLKDVSNALITSKELLKILNRIWAHADQPSSGMSLVSALHAELERARLQVNQLIQEQRSDQNEISYLVKCFAEEKAAWKKKEHQAIESAIEAVASELEVERKLRRRFESLNKKLGKELAETKESLIKSVKEVETEKRAREIMEQVCDELARDIDEDKIHEAVEPKHSFEEKSLDVDKLRNQLEDFLRNKRDTPSGRDTPSCVNDEEIAAYFSRAGFGTNPNEEKEDIAEYISRGRFGTNPNEEKEDIAEYISRGRYGTNPNEEKEDIAAYISRARFGTNSNEEKDGEVDDGDEEEDSAAESDLHSIELNMDNNKKSYKWLYTSGVVARDAKRDDPIDVKIKGRNSTSGKPPRRSNSLQRTVSLGVEWGVQAENVQNTGGEGLMNEVEKQAHRRSHGDEKLKYVWGKSRCDQFLHNSRMGSSARDVANSSPNRHRGGGEPWPLRGPGNKERRNIMMQESGLKPRALETKGEPQNARRS